MGLRILFAAERETAVSGMPEWIGGRTLSVDAVTDAEAGLSRLRMFRYDAVCIDVRFGGGRGVEFARDLRAYDGSPPLVLTADLDNDDLRAEAARLERTAFAHRAAGAAGLSRALTALLVPAAPYASSDSAPRVLAYSHDSIGLGHMRRNSHIVSRTLERSPGASALMAIGSPAGFVFDLPPGMDVLKLPSLAKRGREDFHPASLNISQERMRRLRAALLREAVEAFEPDVVLVDHVPTGVWNELTETLARLRTARHRPHVVLGLRDILDTPERTREGWARSGADDVIRSCYDEILVYGDPAVFDTIGVYGLDELAPGRARYCGYVTANAPMSEPRGLRTRLGAYDRPLVLFSGGAAGATRSPS